MECTYLAEGNPRRCRAFHGLMIPSAGEVKEFCVGRYDERPVYRRCSETGKKVTRRTYARLKERMESAS